MNPFAAHWDLDPEVTFLNHGSFGACPRPVLEAQTRLRARMEARPVRFLAWELEPLLDAARRVLADFVGAGPDDLVPVVNATTGALRESTAAQAAAGSGAIAGFGLASGPTSRLVWQAGGEGMVETGYALTTGESVTELLLLRFTDGAWRIAEAWRVVPDPGGPLKAAAGQ